jgi:hypothetical protein
MPPHALVEVKVVARDGSGERVLALCKSCASVPDATWRLAWREVAK